MKVNHRLRRTRETIAENCRDKGALLVLALSSGFAPQGNIPGVEVGPKGDNKVPVSEQGKPYVFSATTERGRRKATIRQRVKDWIKSEGLAVMAGIGPMSTLKGG
jgi:hypothetical protein